MKKKRWRAKENEKYYYISGKCDLVIEWEFDHYEYTNDIKYKIGNYFETGEEAEKKRKEFLKILKHDS